MGSEGCFFFILVEKLGKDFEDENTDLSSGL